jgi:plastocyanin
MRIGRRGLVSVAVLTLSAVAATACGGLAHPVSNDGADAGNPLGINKGTSTLTLTALSPALTVGSGEAITTMYGALPLNGTGNFLPVTLSDSSVISADWSSVYGLSVGNASVTVSYGAAQATIGFSVGPNSDGVSALVAMERYGTGVTAWLPTMAKVKTSWTVKFTTVDNALYKHNVVFDSIPGAPANIPTGTSYGSGALRVFSTPGSFPYRCTIHGEAGVVNVAP